MNQEKPRLSKAEISRRLLAILGVLALGITFCVGNGVDSDAIKTQQAIKQTQGNGEKYLGDQLTAMYKEIENTQKAVGTADAATATYGADLFIEQLTAAARTPITTPTP